MYLGEEALGKPADLVKKDIIDKLVSWGALGVYDITPKAEIIFEGQKIDWDEFLTKKNANDDDDEYEYEQKLLSDPFTMSYNAGYDVNYDGYHYDTGCIDFEEDKWETNYIKRQLENKFFAYIKDIDINQYVGYVNYHYNEKDDKYECGIVIESIYRNKGYSKLGLKILCEEAFKNGIDKLYDSFEKDRENTLKVFESIGFKIVEEKTWKKFNKDVIGVIVCLKKQDYISNIK